MTMKLTFARTANGALDLSEHRLEPLVLALRQRVSGQAVLPESVMDKVNAELARLSYSVASERHLSFLDATRVVAREHPALLELSRATWARDADPDCDVALSEAAA